MRGLNGDGGAVAVLVALLAVVLFGLGALVIDVGALYAERRDLQNGADAAAFAVAQACAGGDCGSFLPDARGFASGNATDEVSRVEDGEVCGSTDAGLPACVDPPSGLAGVGYVRVTTRTQQQDGTLLVPPFLARVLVPDYQGTEVTATATVIWGPIAGIDGELAITFSQCEYDNLTRDEQGNAVYAKDPFEDTALLRTIYFHDTTAAGTCDAGPSGSDLPGGFGWLDADESCQATIENGWVEDSTGAAASKGCKQALDALLNKTIAIPVFSETNGLTGTNGQYLVTSYVGFRLTGYRFPGASFPTGKDAPCASSQTCIQGYFTELVVPATAPVGSGSDQGVRGTQLVS